MTDGDLFNCEFCGGEFPFHRCALGMNLGVGPEYICDRCAPPTAARHTIEIIEAAMGNGVTAWHPDRPLRAPR